MQNLQVTHSFVRKLSKNVREAIGKDVIPHTKAMELVADALGWQAGPLMNALKKAEPGFDDSSPKAGPVVPATPKGGRDNPPELSDFSSISASSVSALREFGKNKTGLVLIVGENGAGKTMMGNALLRQWVRDSGNLAVTSGERIEYPSLGGVHGEGMIVQNRTDDRQSVRQASPVISAYNPSYVLFEDHLRLEGKRDQSNLEDFMDAIEESRKRVVIISALEVSVKRFTEVMAKRLSADGRMTLDEASQHIHGSLSVVIGISRTPGMFEPSVFRANVFFEDSIKQSAGPAGQVQ
jgi:hypothetical protein